MRKFLATVTFLTCSMSPAFAGDDAAAPAVAAPPAEAPAEAPPPVENCAALTGEEKTACDARVKAAAEAAAAAKAAEAGAPADKGGKAQRANTNRMESEFSDE